MASLADESIIADFVAESREHLSTIEPDLLAMEDLGSKVSQEVINRVFRAIHSLKGGAGFFAFEALKRLSHAMESVLMLVRDGKLHPTPELMDSLFTGVDRLRAMLDDIHASDSVPYAKELAGLEAILSGQGVNLSETVKGREKGTKRDFDLDAEGVRSALRRGMNLYRAIAYLHHDIKDQGLAPLQFLNNAMSVGTCLDAFIDIEVIADLEHCLEQDLPVTLLFASVLEPDLAALALKLPVEQVKVLEVKALKEMLKAKTKAAKPSEAAPPPPPPPPVEEAQPEAEAVPEDKPEARGPAAKEGGNETLRVRVDLLTNLMNLAGELVLGRNQLVRAISEYKGEIPGLGAILQNVNQVTTEMQEGIMQTRMQPIGTVFSRFPRIIRDMSRQLGKQIEVHIEGAEVELDKSIVEMLVDPLTHIIRNCADHAIEGPAERKKAKKNPTGAIHLHAFHEGGQINIAVHDDGRGIDSKKVLEKALAKGLVTKAQAAEMTEREIVHLVFAPGFSTAETVSDISGRGVGMDVVRTNVEKLGGHVEVETEVGMGTTVRLRLPLTLAIIPSMIVGVADHRFAIPQVNVVEFVWVKASEVVQRIEQVQGALVLRLRDKLLPLVRLADVLGIQRVFTHPATGEELPDRRTSIADRRAEASAEDAEAFTREGDRRADWRSDHNIIVLRVGKNQYGVIVDELYDIEEIVVKPLSSFIQGTKCFSGATILGDGRVIMILDAGGLSTAALLHFSDLQAEELRRAEEEKRNAALKASRRRSVILFEGARGERFAVPQDHVLRLERILRSKIELIGEREYIEYRGEGLPLLRLDQHLEVRPLAKDLEELFLVIPKIPGQNSTARPPAGILISEILDALDVEVELKKVEFEGPGLLGSAVVQNHLTLFLDPVNLLRAAGLMGGDAA
ncbi:chemotaxis protein CheA [Geothrix sp. 21YS21S-2]|uniref:chemotaxis protein CheA n=1 Tax=Geothrix sp. 21YS21S-2 TaxID=3068893 RepID=UPI0027B988FC|nr:chemotaxis protein CheA [Geothrix sp. 21YS21S-2]